MTRRRRDDALPPDQPGITDPADWQKLEKVLSDVAAVEGLALPPFERRTAAYRFLAYYLLQDDGAELLRQREGTRAWLCSALLHALNDAEEQLLTPSENLMRAFDAGRLVERLLVKLAVEPDAIRGFTSLKGAGHAALVKAQRAEADGATLTRRFESLQAASDHGLDRQHYERIAQELRRGKLRLKQPMKSLTASAVARKIQRYRRDLR